MPTENLNEPSVNRQKEHYEGIADQYTSHYFDKWSMAYRKEFIYPKLWEGLDLTGKRVAELACGAGANSEELRTYFADVHLEGFDISPTACLKYSALVQAPAHEVDLTRPLPDDMEPFDAVFVFGGIHHCVADLRTTLENVSKLVKPGGVFIMMEPSSLHMLEALRKIWYKLDSKFDSGNEAALNHDELVKIAGQWFQPHSLIYFGGPAYFGVLNSLILKIPLWLKPFLSPALMAAERKWNRLSAPYWHNAFISQWIRKG